MKHHFLTPLQDAAPHVQSKQHLKLFLIISESVDCLVCSDEDLRRNILTDFASINWLTVSTYIYSYHHILKQLRIFIDPNKYTSAKKIFEDYLHTSSHITKIQIVTYRSYQAHIFTLPTKWLQTLLIQKSKRNIF